MKAKVVQAKFNYIAISVLLDMIYIGNIFVAAKWDSLKTLDQFQVHH